MFRMIPTTNHNDEDIELTVKAFREMRDELKLDLAMEGDDLKNVTKIYV